MSKDDKRKQRIDFARQLLGASVLNIQNDKRISNRDMAMLLIDEARQFLRDD